MKGPRARGRARLGMEKNTCDVCMFFIHWVTSVRTKVPARRAVIYFVCTTIYIYRTSKQVYMWWIVVNIPLFSISSTRWFRWFVDSLTRWLKLGRACFVPYSAEVLVRPNQDGERGERLTNTLFGAKDGERHRQERALVLTSLRRTMRRCALATLSYYTTIWYLVQSMF